ncbi:hypothetical protein H6P81_014109 [Aristolochia fimbriata]|uniref:CobW C-terminal domain-containing protein n=1 Tax=Aristolochia fimbriata TaxID=158543 RepID=A0AAV7EHR8_ARIFI|nr:hypothetical protein H6P81_014109 [Aristolochia fimbriata]
MEGNEMSLAYESRVFDRRSGLNGGRMACTLVTGFLGSGKTTLMKHILENRGDLRIAVLVNEFADSDVDSLLLNSASLNAAFNLSTVSLTHGCDCCNVGGPFRESLLQVVNSKHNFDCLLIETSGLAKPDIFVAELEEVGIHLDLTIAVVDAESLDKILSMDIVKQQLQHVDLVLLNKCDLATLGQISDAENALESLTGGAKVVRSQFCKVPLDLVIDFSKADSQLAVQDAVTLPFLSHEALPQMTFRENVLGKTSVGVSASSVSDEELILSGTNWRSSDSENASSHERNFSSVSFDSEDPLLMSLFQSSVLATMRNTNNLLRAKGILWFEEDRESRFVFQWSGIKRVEAICGGMWENAPKSCLVLIGTDKSELENIVMQLSQSTISKVRTISCIPGSRESAKSFCARVLLDGRFKEPVFDKEPLVIFGLKGSPLHGIKESQLNGPLMHLVNGKGRVFLSAVVSGQEYNLQLLLDNGCNPDEAWNEIRMAASAVIFKVCKNFCPCRSDLSAHVH